MACLQEGKWQSIGHSRHTIKEGDLVRFTVLRYALASTCRRVGLPKRLNWRVIMPSNRAAVASSQRVA